MWPGGGEPRVTQVDVRLSCLLFRFAGTARLRGDVDIYKYNIFNASSVRSMMPTCGLAWLNAAQVDF